MTTPTGTISMSDVNVELSKPSASVITLNDGDVRGLAGIPSGTISMDDLRGKTAVNYGALTPNFTTRSEGQSFTFTLAGGTLPNGTYYWRLELLSNLSSLDFTAATSGSFTVSSNTGSFTVTTVNDTLDEGNGTFRALVGESAGVPLARVTSPTCTVTETTTYTATVDKTSIYRYGSFLTDRAVTVTLNTTQVPVGTTIYYSIESVSGTVTFAPGPNTGDLTGTSTGSRTISGTVAAGTASVGVSAVEYINGTSVVSKSFRVLFYKDASLTDLVATSPTVTIRAAPTYALSFSPTSVNEGSTSTGTITTTNFPPGVPLYYSTSGTASATADWAGGSSTGSITISSGTTTFPVTAAYDGTTESNETLTFSLRTVSTTGDIVATGSLTIVQAFGTVTTLTAAKTGGATLGSSVTMTLRIASIPAYPLSRTFNITYSLNGGAYTNAAPLLATTITVAANATSSSTVTVVDRTTDTVLSSLIFRVTLTGHTTKDSNTLSGGYI